MRFALFLVIFMASFSANAERNPLDIKSAIVIFSSKMSIEMRAKFALLTRELGQRSGELYQKQPFKYVFDANERKKCPDVHSVIQHDKCEARMQKYFKGGEKKQTKIGIVVSFKQDGGYFGFWIKTFLPNGTVFVRHGKLSTSRTMACFGLVFRRYAKNVLNISKAMDTTKDTTPELGALTCIPRRKIILTSSLIIEGRGFFDLLKKRLKTKGYSKDVSFQTPTKALVKSTVGCKDLQTQCEKDYASQTRASARLVFEGYSDVTNNTVHIKVKKYTPQASGGEKLETVNIQLAVGALDNSQCKSAVLSGVFLWILRERSGSVLLPNACKNVVKKPIRQIALIGGASVGALGIVMIGVGIVTGAMTLGVRDDFIQQFNAAETREQMMNLNPLYDEGKHLSLMTNVFWGIGVSLMALGGTGIALALLYPKASKTSIKMSSKIGSTPSILQGSVFPILLYRSQP